VESFKTQAINLKQNRKNDSMLENNSKKPLILLDLDGTLLDTSNLYFAGIPPIVEKYLNLRISKEEIIPLWGKFARKFFAYFAKQCQINDAALIDQMYEEFSQFYNQEHNRLSQEYPYVDQKLSQLKHAGFKIGVVTTRPTSRSKPVYAWSWTQYLDFIIWGDMVDKGKPAPDGIDLAMTRYNPDGRGVYVGDNAHDIAAGKNSRFTITTVAALWGTMDSKALMGAEPDQAFDTFCEFADWLLR
jgi:pyrophosphatase PpaX